MFSSSILRFGLLPTETQDPAPDPPVWSILIYMLLVETLNIDDKTVEEGLGLVVPVEDPFSLDLGLKSDSRRRRRSGRLETMKEMGALTEVRNHSFSSFSSCADESLRMQAPESMTIRCLDGRPMKLTLIDAPISQRAKKQHQLFVHFDSQLCAGWSAVYASSKSHIVIKFAAVPKKSKVELLRQLSNEKAAYNKLKHISGFVVPLLYGEYEWYGGRSLVLSSEGRSLESFSLLSFVER